MYKSKKDNHKDPKTEKRSSKSDRFYRVIVGNFYQTGAETKNTPMGILFLILVMIGMAGVFFLMVWLASLVH